jgi:uncharacterized phage-like protein YoqJ
MTKELVVAGTGHRPENCEDEKIVRTKARVKLQYTPGIKVFICGMAAGFDLWAGDEALKLGLEVWAAKPWTGHTHRKGDRELYERIIAGASRVVNVVEQDAYPGVWVYHNRDKWMVDNADVVMAYWNGWEKGGTFGTREYAKNVAKKPVTNIYHDPPF